MDKNEAVDIIKKAAALYEKYFKDKNLLIIYGNKSSNNLSYSSLSFYETIASARNFAHLTGVLLNESAGINAELFYDKAIGRNNDKIFDTDFNFRSDNTTFMKLSVIETALNVAKNFKICGNYNENSSHENLKTGFLVGSTNGSIGFCLDNHSGNRRIYVPNTLLKGDIRDETSPSVGVLAVFSKNIREQSYQEIVRLADNIHAENFIKELQKVLQQYNQHNPNQMIQINITLSQEQENKDKIILLANDLHKARSSYFKKSFSSTLKTAYINALYSFFDTIHDGELYDYASQLLKLHSKTETGRLKINEAECIKNERCQIRNLQSLNNALKNLTDKRTDYMQNPYSESAMNAYLVEQGNFAEFAVKNDFCDYVIKLLQSQQKESPELISLIDDDIQAVQNKKLEYDTAPRKVYFSFSHPFSSLFSANNTDAAVQETEKVLVITLPPKRPFKALMIKAEKIVRNIADSLRKPEEPKEESLWLQVYGMSAKKHDDYTEITDTGRAFREINLQTGLSLEQKTVQEHHREPERICQTEQVRQPTEQPETEMKTKRKQKDWEYDD